MRALDVSSSSVSPSLSIKPTKHSSLPVIANARELSEDNVPKAKYLSALLYHPWLATQPLISFINIDFLMKLC